MSLASSALGPRPTARVRWTMWALPTAVFLIAFFHRPAPGVVTKELMQAFNADATMIGLLSAAYFYTYAGLMIPAGVLVDAYGVRRTVTVGGLVMGVGALLMALAPASPALFAGRLAVGAGASVTFVGALKIAATWFPPSDFGLLAALTATAGTLGGFVATSPLAALVAWLGWRGAFAAVGLLTLALAVLTAIAVRDRAAGDGSRLALGVVLAGVGEVLRNPRTWPPCAGFFCLYAASGNLMLWVIPYLRDVYGLSRSEAAACASVVSLAFSAAGPGIGWFSDRLGRRRPPYVILTLGFFATWVAFVATLGTLPLAGVAGVLALLGVFGASFVLVWPIGRDVNPPRLAGVAVAVVNFGGFLGAAVTQAPFGALLDARWQGVLIEGARVYPLDAYRAAFGTCAGFALASCVAGMFLGDPRAGGPR